MACLLLLGQARLQTIEQKKQQEELLLLKETGAEQEKIMSDTAARRNGGEETETEEAETKTAETERTGTAKSGTEPVMLEQYRELYEKNNDLVGWLTIGDTVIDYPVMQCEDNEYYLHHDFYGEDSKYGCLYVKDVADPAEGTNFIIYGHNMKDGSMFGDLDEYRSRDFYLEHSTISFDTLYEERTYEIVAVFLSQVYYSEDDVFKYYQFYQADTQEEFEDFYENIKKLSLYDTEEEAEFGDTFLTLSTCAYHVKDGRFVVVAKRLAENNTARSCSALSAALLTE